MQNQVIRLLSDRQVQMKKMTSLLSYLWSQTEFRTQMIVSAKD